MEQLRRALNPMAEYRRVFRQFWDAVGDVPASSPQPDEFEVDGTDSLQSNPDTSAQLDPELVVHLVSLAWPCAWLIAEGINVERFGEIMFSALALAARLSAGKHS